MFSSSLLGRNTYIGFGVDWVLEACAILMSTVLYISAGSFYIGVCVYINAMVTDMKERLKSPAFGSNSGMAIRWTSITKEIDLHNEIITYDSDSYTSCHFHSVTISTQSSCNKTRMNNIRMIKTGQNAIMTLWKLLRQLL